jgi:hypothetical protein
MIPDQVEDRLAAMARLSIWITAALVFGGAIINIFRHVYFETAIALSCLAIFIYVQFFLSRTGLLRNPPVMQLLISLLILVSLFIGRFFTLYKNLPGFDKSQHLLYGIIFCVIGFVLFYRLNPGQRQTLTVSPLTVALFAACFALLCGFGWEIYEFTNDRLFNTDMQAWKQTLTRGPANGLIDTMLDMMADLAGSALVATLGGRWLRRDAAGFYQRYIAGFMPLRKRDGGR